MVLDVLVGAMPRIAGSSFSPPPQSCKYRKISMPKKKEVDKT
jgi:hypothetical protein